MGLAAAVVVAAAVTAVTATSGCTEPNPAFSGSDGGGGGSDGPLKLDTVKLRGTEGGPCYPNNTCNAGLICVNGTCRRPGKGDGGQTKDGSGPDQNPNADNDNDGFTVGQGDCDDFDPYVNPGAVEIEGIGCSSGSDCPSGQCQEGYCRCTSAAHCSSGKACTKDEHCSFAGETCIGGKCSSSLQCLPPQTGMSLPAVNVCRDATDNDCNGKTDEMPTACDDLSQLNDGNAYDHARAIGLCGSGRACVSAACPGGQACRDGSCWWVTSAGFNSGSDAKSRDIAKEFAQGGPFAPVEGQSFVVLSTGLADYDPKTKCPQSGTAFTNEETDPNPKATDSKAYDPTALSLTLQVPTNARSLEFHFSFFSAEYPELQYLDTFWVHLESKQHKGNITFDTKGTPMRADSELFTICDPDNSKPSTKQQCTKPAATLTGTGYAKDCSDGGRGKNQANGGATGWVRTSAPVTPGEVIKLTFSIYDKSDHLFDSTVLIDQFRWGLVPAGQPISVAD